MTPEPYKPSTSTIREEEEEVQVKQEFPDEKMVDPDEDDPIVESIPLLINTVPERAKQSLHVLQYADRPKSRPNRAGNCHASIKPESQYLQVKVPLILKNSLTSTKFKNGVNKLLNKPFWVC